MVVGKTSSFVEGFKSFSVDDELMLANLKQALNYSADSLAIPDSNLKLPSNNSSNTNPTKQTNFNSNSNMSLRNSPMQTMGSMMPTMGSPMPTMDLPIPNMGSPMPTMGSMMPKMNSPMPTMGSTMPTMGSMMQMKEQASFRDIKRVRDHSYLDNEDDTDDDDENAVLDEEDYTNKISDDLVRKYCLAKGEIIPICFK
jgi:hypothetical protein